MFTVKKLQRKLGQKQYDVKGWGVTAIGPDDTLYRIEDIYPDAAAHDIRLVVAKDDRVTWHLVVLLLDKLDKTEKADIPLKEVAGFLRKYSRFELKLTFLTFNDPHEYTHAGDEKYDLYWSVLPQKWLNLIPPCSSVLALYKLYERTAYNAGSTWGLPEGIPVHGKLRPWAAIPVDVWWYNNEPYQGFKSRAAQIGAHETVNAIQGKLMAPPYNCERLTATDGDPAWKHESERLSKIRPECYAALGRNED